MRVLIVEDDHRLATSLRRVLSESGMVADVTYDGEEGLAAAMGAEYDVIVLDLRLPLLNGRQVAGRLRDERVHTPILMLTALDATDEEVVGLAGIDDHLVKPFSQRELMARIRALSRRHRTDHSARLRAGRIQLDPVAHVVLVGDQQVDLTPKEFAILEYFMLSPGRLLSKTRIIEHVWDYDFDGGHNLVEVYIGQLRRKLAAAGSDDPFVTVRGAGYRFEPPR
ncbi:MAG TPA: response regulator transcription factor [Candidatus Dormibacteraeota bacterium]|nr:response regulator transcription factor [Candidatus Dormibacteraeota bacterium]